MMLKGWDQCGGKSGCAADKPCIDGQWPGYCCPVGFKCTRNDGFFYNCQGQMTGGGSQGGGGQKLPRKFAASPAVPFRRASNGECWGARHRVGLNSSES